MAWTSVHPWGTGYENSDMTGADQAELQRQGYANQRGIAELNARTALAPLDFAKQKFDKLFPYLTSQFSGLQRGLGMAGGAAAGGPHISAGPIFDPQQVQQQVNLGRAYNDQKTASTVNDLRASLAGRGYGANSPVAALLGSNLQAQNAATNAAQATQTRFNAAGQNAAQVLRGQTAQESQYAARMQEENQRRGIAAGSMNQLIAALSGLA